MLLLADFEQRPAAIVYASLQVPPLFSVRNKVTIINVTTVRI
jgi:hypothetical protein